MTAKYPELPGGVIAIFPGSFDPFTIGHLSVVERALPLVEKLIILVGVNDAKPHATPADKRIKAIRKATASLGQRVEIAAWEGLTADFASKVGAKYLIRGARTAADFDFEYTLATVNRDIAGLETIIIPTLPEHAAVSSSVVRELTRFGYDPAKYLP